MIQGMFLNNVKCVIDEMATIDNNNGFYNYHTEQWDLYQNKEYIGFVMIQEDLPLVEDEKYQLQFYVVSTDIHKPQGYDRIHKQLSRKQLLQAAVNYLKN